LGPARRRRDHGGENQDRERGNSPPDPSESHVSQCLRAWNGRRKSSAERAWLAVNDGVSGAGFATDPRYSFRTGVSRFLAELDSRHGSTPEAWG
jgi:hypothetical protein